ncbi:alpha/beta hydrolase, partial [Burkholderia territorii]
PGAVLWPAVADWLAHALDAPRAAGRPPLSIAAGNRA